jgi:hypothetical protein
MIQMMHRSAFLSSFPMTTEAAGKTPHRGIVILHCKAPGRDRRGNSALADRSVRRTQRENAAKTQVRPTGQGREAEKRTQLPLNLLIAADAVDLVCVAQNARKSAWLISISPLEND